MDFDKVLKLLISEFDKERVRYALIGGFALGAFGIVRATMDLDFLLYSDDIQKVDKILKQYGYYCVHDSENVAQYIAEDKALGEIDFLKAFRAPSLSLLKEAQLRMVGDKKLVVKVVNPEGIIGLKIQALVNDAAREYRELADIERIMQAFKGQLDWKVIKEYFLLFKKDSLYKEMWKKYGKIK